MVRRLAPELSIALPLGKPNSGPAIAAAARALSIDRLLAQEFIRSLYQLFWVGGKDISSQQLLQDTAERRGLPPAQICGKTALPIDDQLCVWEARWNETEHSGVPLVQRSRARSWLGSFRPVLSGVSSAKAYACRN